MDRDAVRHCQRLRRTGESIFTFLEHASIPFENNFAERMIRPAVVLRKNSQSNRSERGAATQAILMSVYRTYETAEIALYHALGRLPEPKLTHEFC